MCFVEFIAYTCGHASVAVNRPCPLTTQLHSNPCCAKPATRPSLAHTMCGTCSRIIHGRRVQIWEGEHRWMHERGVCPCPVIFPGMWQPRLIQRSSNVEDENVTAAATGATAGAHNLAGSPAFSSQARQSNRSGQGEEVDIPLFKEIQVGNTVEIAVRRHSLYAAEWTKDHSKLHESGQCKCPVSFERYQPQDISYGQDNNNFSGPGHYPMNTRNPTAPAPTPLPYNTHAGTPSTVNRPTTGPRNPPGFRQVPTGHVARWAGEGPQGSLLDEILGPVRPDASAYGRPVDVQTVHYSTVGNPIAGNPIAWGTPQSALPSIVEFPQPDTTIAGLPIGAGPEGDSHAGNFEDCSLNASNTSTRDSPVRQRRLSSEF